MVPSQRWNHTRWLGGAFNRELSSYVLKMLEDLGYQAVAPNFEIYFSVTVLENGRASNWSERHIAYAAGLGTFGLSDGFITPKGIAVRCGSVITDAAIPASPRIYSSHRSNCLFYQDGSCGICIKRCPASAITEKGHDKIKCKDFVRYEQRDLLRKSGLEQGYMGDYPACGSCQTKIPCEDRIPPGIKGI
jgi:epoxyqueuosine reductase QueG